MPASDLGVRPTQNTPMRLSGNLRSWNDERGFGFIQPALGGMDIFVHIKAFPPSTGRPTIGQVLTFEVELGPNGKKRAHSVQYLVPNRAPKIRRAESPASWTLPRLLAIPAFALVWLYVASQWTVKPIVLQCTSGSAFWRSLHTLSISRRLSMDAGARRREHCTYLAWLAAGLAPFLDSSYCATSVPSQASWRSSGSQWP